MFTGVKRASQYVYCKTNAGAQKCSLGGSQFLSQISYFQEIALDILYLTILVILVMVFFYMLNVGLADNIKDL